METVNHNAIVITGGPGMGKTAIIEKLSERGHFCIKESGRHIIQQQLQTGGNLLPWADKQGFAEQMLKMGLGDYENAFQLKSLVFFDRAILDVIGYMKLCGLPIHDDVWQCAQYKRYHSPVFVTPPWREIYLNDSERKQSFEEATATYEVMLHVYAALNYTIVEIPRDTVEKRTDFILSHMDDKCLPKYPQQ